MVRSLRYRRDTGLTSRTGNAAEPATRLKRWSSSGTAGLANPVSANPIRLTLSLPLFSFFEIDCSPSMPDRLNVIMIESAPQAGSARRMSEAVVGELIGLAGIDLTLVESLARMSETSTDKLMLDGITGDVCVLDWQSPESMIASLHDKGFAGQRSPHPHDVDAATSMSSSADRPMRRIYAFELNRFSDAKTLCEALMDLRAVREVRTFSLGAPSSTTPPAAEKPGMLADSKPPSLRVAPPPDSRATDDDPSTSQGKTPSHKPLASQIDLEALVDQLDDFDS